MNDRINVALLGCGTVGSAVAQFFASRENDFPLGLSAIVVRDVAKPRCALLSKSLFTTDGESVVDDPQIDIVVDCYAGIEPAHSLVRRALHNKKHVVSSNKAMLATHLPELRNIADLAGVELFYDAAVAGAIPIVSTLRTALAYEEIAELSGVLNGTSNYILWSMQQGKAYGDALREAQELGYAELDPTNDVSGIDTAQKLSLLTHLLFRRWIRWQDISRIGIEHLMAQDLERAASAGRVLRLVASVEQNGELRASVFPREVPADSWLGTCVGSTNAIRLVGRRCGELTFRGPGAGGQETASAILGDLAAIARTYVSRRYRAEASIR